MLTCIACSKQLEGEDSARGTPSTKEAVKSLTSQIKDMVIKFSGVYKQCKLGGSSSSSLHKDHQYGPFVGICDDRGVVRDARSGRWKQQLGKSGGGPGSDGLKMNQYEVWSKGVGVEVAAVDARATLVVEEAFEDAKEWVAQVEPGVHITFLALPQGGNDLKRIRFSRELFNKWQAQRWWGENYDKVMELYNVQRFNRQALPTPPRSEDERGSPFSRADSTRESPAVTPPWGNCKDLLSSTAASSRAPTATSTTKPPDSATATNPVHRANTAGGVATAFAKGEAVSADVSRTTSSHDEASISASDAEVNEWVEQDEPGVYITVRQLPDGTRELRRVRFSRERFGEVHAKLWWEENRERIHAQYL